METAGIDRERFGAFISELRKEKGWTQQELADTLFISNKAVSKWERGQSLPDVELLLPLSRTLGVSVTELLSARRIPPEEPMNRRSVDKLMEETVQRSAQVHQQRKQDRRKWALAWVACAVITAAESVLLPAAGHISFDWLINYVYWVEGLCLIFGGWACLLAHEALPAYYDQNKISAYSQGPFRMNLPGVRFNNSNWPHMLRVLRLWFLIVPAVFPLLGWAAFALHPNAVFPLSLVSCLGFFVPLYIVGLRYQ